MNTMINKIQRHDPPTVPRVLKWHRATQRKRKLKRHEPGNKKKGKTDGNNLINPTVQMSSLHRNTLTKDQSLNIQPTPTNRITTRNQQDKILTWT